MSEPPCDGCPPEPCDDRRFPWHHRILPPGAALGLLILAFLVLLALGLNPAAKFGPGEAPVGPPGPSEPIPAPTVRGTAYERPTAASLAAVPVCMADGPNVELVWSVEPAPAEVYVRPGWIASALDGPWPASWARTYPLPVEPVTADLIDAATLEVLATIGPEVVPDACLATAGPVTSPPKGTAPPRLPTVT